MKKLIILFIAVAGFGVSSFGQETVTKSTTATAEIITPITLSITTPMNFGNIIASVSGGTVALSAEATALRTESGVALSAANPGTIKAIALAVGGQANYAYTITTPPSAVALKKNGQPDMTADTFTLSTGAGTLGEGGTQTVYIGATLHVGGNQGAGTYTSDAFNITVAYN